MGKVPLHAGNVVKLLSVNVSVPRRVTWRGREVLTGIFKEPVRHRASLGPAGLAGDGQADLSAHGGTYKAVYVYPHEHYAFWAGELGRDDLTPGQFGENLTTEGLLEDSVHIGDVFRVGTARLEVTQPRTPCFKLGVKMGSATFPKRFLASERSGFYVRVVAEGALGAGDEIEHVARDPEQMTVHEVHHLFHFDKGNLREMQRVLRIPALSPSWREVFEERLAKAGR